LENGGGGRGGGRKRLVQHGGMLTADERGNLSALQNNMCQRLAIFYTLKKIIFGVFNWEI
jgi:hypothetical protein